MNEAIEVHDSTLRRLESSDGDLVAVVEAYLHRSPGRPGIDRGTGWSQVVHLNFRGGKASGSEAELPLWLLDGRLVLSGETFDNTIPLPVDHAGACRLELEAANEVRILLEGDGLTAELIGEATYVEDFEP